LSNGHGHLYDSGIDFSDWVITKCKVSSDQGSRRGFICLVGPVAVSIIDGERVSYVEDILAEI